VSLPKIVTPEYTVQLKSIKAPVRFRPYLVKEEKVLLTAKETDDPTEIDRAVRQILRECTFNALDIDKLPSFDIELLFLQLRARSVNNIIEVRYQCQNKVDDNETRCGTVNAVRIPVDDIKIETPEGHTNIVQLTDDITLQLRYPTVETVKEIIVNGRVSPSLSSHLVASCIQSMVTKDGTVYETQDYPKDELIAFVESLSIQQIDKLQVFFNTMPFIRYETTFQCSKCGYEEPLVYEGINDFFD